MDIFCLSVTALGICCQHQSPCKGSLTSPLLLSLFLKVISYADFFKAIIFDWKLILLLFYLKFYSVSVPLYNINKTPGLHEDKKALLLSFWIRRLHFFLLPNNWVAPTMCLVVLTGLQSSHIPGLQLERHSDSQADLLPLFLLLHISN